MWIALIGSDTPWWVVRSDSKERFRWSWGSRAPGPLESGGLTPLSSGSSVSRCERYPFVVPAPAGKEKRPPEGGTTNQRTQYEKGPRAFACPQPGSDSRFFAVRRYARAMPAPAWRRESSVRNCSTSSFRAAAWAPSSSLLEAISSLPAADCSVTCETP